MEILFGLEKSIHRIPSKEKSCENGWLQMLVLLTIFKALFL
jgi:hypothetical protein